MLAALALARAGAIRRAEAIANELEAVHAEHRPHALPTTQHPGRHCARSRETGQRTEVLEPARAFELGQPTPSGLAPLYPVYLRGAAYLLLHNGSAAAMEFQKIIDNPRIAVNVPLGALALLQRARAAALSNDKSSARSSYQSFIALWKSADSNVPILVSAKLQLARLG
jgi:eukaryotic-like serine/threonine-protein kinase